MPRHDASSASTRTASRSQSKNYLPWSTAGVEGRRAGVHVGPSRRDAAAEHGRAPRVPPRPRAAVVARRLHARFATRWTPTRSRAPEQERQANDRLLRHRELAEVVEAARFGGLKDPALMNKKRADEKALRDRVDAKSGAQGASTATPGIRSRRRARALPPTTSSACSSRAGSGFYTQYFTLARTLRALGRRKREAERPAAAGVHRRAQAADRAADGIGSADLSRASSRPSSTASLDGDAADELGADHPLVKQILGRQDRRRRGPRSSSPARSWAMRRCARRCFAGGTAAVDALEGSVHRAGAARRRRARASCARKYDNEVLGVERDAYAKIAQAVFAIAGRRARIPTARSRCGCRTAR